MSFTNLYYKRTAGTARACFICYRPTPTVLATAQNVDFIYVCESHLNDPGFATAVGETGDGGAGGGVKKLALTPEEIAKVKEEWEAKQKRKAEKEKDKKENSDKDKDKDKDKEKEKDEPDKEKKKSNSGTDSIPTKSLPPPPPTPQPPTHVRYTLHRDIFAMRLGEHRKWRQAAQAKALAPRLPGAPRNGMLP